MEDRSLSIKAKKKVKAEVDRAAKERQIALFQRRMDLARQGAVYYKQHRYKEAMESFYRYLEILEKFKQVRPGEVEPKHFDEKKDIAELLLLTGVFWDLAKIHDRFGKNDTSRLTQYLDRFVLFAKGMPYQHVCTEMVRKFLVNGTPKHRKFFKETHIKLGGEKCFVVTAVSDYCKPDTLTSLRDFRDTVLAKNSAGRLFIRFYYRVGPAVARLVIRSPEVFQKKLAGFFDRLASRLPH